MQLQPFVIERTYNAPIALVWQAITDIEQLRQWYFDLPAFKPEIGFEFRFGGNSSDKIYRHVCKITELIPGKKIAYSWRYEDYEGNSTVRFELFEEGNRTRLKLTHEGLETFPKNNPDLEMNSFAAGWTHIIGNSLKEFLEKPAV